MLCYPRQGLQCSIRGQVNGHSRHTWDAALFAAWIYGLHMGGSASLGVIDRYTPCLIHYYWAIQMIFLPTRSICHYATGPSYTMIYQRYGATCLELVLWSRLMLAPSFLRTNTTLPRCTTYLLFACPLYSRSLFRDDESDTLSIGRPLTN